MENIQSLREMGTEEEHQKRFFEQIELLIPIWPDFDSIIHIPNSGAGPLRGMAGRMKAMGTKPGVSDIFYPAPRGGFHGAWIELKSMKASARISESQKQWLKNMSVFKYFTKLCHGCDNALIILVGYETGYLLPIEFIKKLHIWYKHPFGSNRTRIQRFIDEQAKTRNI